MRSFRFCDSLMVIIDRKGEGAEQLLLLCEEAILGGAHLIQFRDKSGRIDEVAEIGREMADLCHRHGVPMILNDYATLVDRIGADGLHIGQSDGSIADARQRIGRGRLLGVSAATVEEAVRAEREGADYIGCGHIYPTATKAKATSPLGVEGLKRVVGAVKIPVLAIGGVTKVKIAELREAKPAGVVVCSAVRTATSARQECQLLINALQRYRRQIVLPAVGVAGQRRLAEASVLVVGCGGLGCPALQYLVGAGVGRIGMVDNDRVEASNLPRQPLFTPFDIGRNKAEVAKERLALLNPEVELAAYPEGLTENNFDRVAADYAILLDATDRPEGRYLISKRCKETGKAHVYGAIEGWKGQLSLFNVADQEKATSYSDLFPTPPVGALRCVEMGVLGPVAGMIGTAMALETLKLILGINSPLSDHLLCIGLTDWEERLYSLSKHKTGVPFLMPLSLATVPTITLSELKARLDSPSPPLLIDVRERSEPVEGHIGGLWLPMQELFQSPPALKKGESVVVYCRSGRRSLLAAHFLLDRFPDAKIYSLDGEPILLCERTTKE